MISSVFLLKMMISSVDARQIKQAIHFASTRIFLILIILSYNNWLRMNELKMREIIQFKRSRLIGIEAFITALICFAD